MDFMFTGFREDHGIRRYTFRGVFGDRTQGEFTVHADTVLLQKYGISFQELPLLCRRLLERKQPNRPGEAVMFSEDLMREHADEREASKQNAQMHKKKYHKPNSGVPGEAWRGLRYIGRIVSKAPRPNGANPGTKPQNANGQAARILRSMAGTPESCVSKKFDVGDKHYLLFKQELASSPESAAFGVFLLPSAEYALPLVERLQSPVDTEEEM